jgi:hypothetical protein
LTIAEESIGAARRHGRERRDRPSTISDLETLAALDLPQEFAGALSQLADAPPSPSTGPWPLSAMLGIEAGANPEEG